MRIKIDKEGLINYVKILFVALLFSLPALFPNKIFVFSYTFMFVFYSTYRVAKTIE